MHLKRVIVENLPRFLMPWWQRLESSPLAYRLAKGTFWNLLGAVISRGLGLVSAVVAARVVGKTGFGELGMIQSTVGLFGVFAGLGIGITANRHVAQLRRSDPCRAGRIIALSSVVAWGSGTAMTTVMALCAPWLAAHTLSAPHVAPLLRIGSLLLLFGAVNGAQTGALSGFEAFRALAKTTLISGILSFPIAVAGVLWFGLEGMVWAMVISQALTCFLMFLAIRQEAAAAHIPLRYDGLSTEFPVLWRFSLPALLSTITTAPVYWVCTTLLVNRPNGYSEMGVLNAANQWFNALVFFPYIVGQTVLPMLSERIGQGDHVQSRKLLWLSIRLNAGISVPVLLLGCLASPIIMGLYGQAFRGEWLTLVLVLWTAAAMSMQTPVGYAITAAGRMWTGALMNFGWGLFFVLFTILFLRWGSAGFAGARLCAYMVHAIWTFAYAYRLLRHVPVANDNSSRQ